MCKLAEDLVIDYPCPVDWLLFHRLDGWLLAFFKPYSKELNTSSYHVCQCGSRHGLIAPLEILKEIREETSREEHSRLGMFVLIIMSHGTEGDMLIDHHGKPFSLISIRDSLSPRRFPAMAGKPKLIIVQACSGGRTDFGDLKELSNSELSRSPNASKLHGQQLASSSTPSVSAAVEITELPFFLKPDDEGSLSDRPIVLNVDDFFIMKSSCEAYTSTRSKTHGSWFIRVLVATFYKHSCHRDVESLFKIIQQKVRKVSLSQANYTQGGNVPSAICTFTQGKKLYLFPGFPRR
ncbi:caspase-4-like [Watersipora subatra]|uniref:caspase-4-like n=1 Tax=Watersipora subatra TaxID=2589382 RepID=UPI00355C9540